ncbi:MAG: hypothetical protein ACRD01_02570 [Terriglobales bacterium]
MATRPGNSISQRRHRAAANGRPPSLPLRGAHTGKGKQKRNVISTSSQSLHRSGRGQKARVDIPPGVTGTGEQSS